jgi:hypothetical protein
LASEIVGDVVVVEVGVDVDPPPPPLQADNNVNIAKAEINTVAGVFIFHPSSEKFCTYCVETFRL